MKWQAALTWCALLCSCVGMGADLPPIRPAGTRFVDDQGQQVTLRGCNLGNYLVLETWMLSWFDVPDQYEIERILSERFGKPWKDRWLDSYRANFISDRDFERIKSFGFNCVRLPVHYNLVLEQEPPYGLRADAFRWIDHALDMAQRHGIYVILDLHAAPGCQSKDHNAGRANQNRLWTDAEAQRATVEFWSLVARRYKQRNVIAAYDILNEPYGDHRQDLRGPMLELGKRIYAAIREADPDHIVLLPGVIHGIDGYDVPEVRAIKNIGFTEHFYPGLFGSPSSLLDSAKFLKYGIDGKQRQIEQLGRPFLVGEFNSVLLSNGGAHATAQQFERYAQNGWAATMWSYKILKAEPGAGSENWYLVTNAQTLPKIDLRTSAAEEIDEYVKAIGEVGLEVDRKFIDALAGRTKLAFPVLPELPRQAPADEGALPWKSRDIGGAAPGASALRDGALHIHAGGADIFNRQDSFRFVYQPAVADGEIQATLSELLDTDQYAKAGVMMRFGDAPDAAHVLLHAFPDGMVVLASRTAASEMTRERKLYIDTLPVTLRLRRMGNRFAASFSHDGKSWHDFDELTITDAPREYLAGLAVCSHSKPYITHAVFGGAAISGGKP